jgi:hypothetical protein
VKSKKANFIEFSPISWIPLQSNPSPQWLLTGTDMLWKKGINLNFIPDQSKTTAKIYLDLVHCMTAVQKRSCVSLG